MYEVKNTTRDDVAIMGVPRRAHRSQLLSDMEHSTR
jgi:hypothetical protein